MYVVWRSRMPPRNFTRPFYWVYRNSHQVPKLVDSTLSIDGMGSRNPLFGHRALGLKVWEFGFLTQFASGTSRLAGSFDSVGYWPPSGFLRLRGACVDLPFCRTPPTGNIYQIKQTSLKVQASWHSIKVVHEPSKNALPVICRQSLAIYSIPKFCTKAFGKVLELGSLRRMLDSGAQRDLTVQGSWTL